MREPDERAILPHLFSRGSRAARAALFCSAPLLLIGCGQRDIVGEALFHHCRAENATQCIDQTNEGPQGEQQTGPALFSRAWSRFEEGGTAVMVSFRLDDNAREKSEQTGLLWLDLHLPAAAPDGQPLQRSRWTAEYSEHTPSEIVFSGRKPTGQIELLDHGPIEAEPPSMTAFFDLTFTDSDPAQTVRLTGVVSTVGPITHGQAIPAETGTAGSPAVSSSAQGTDCRDCSDCYTCHDCYDCYYCYYCYSCYRRPFGFLVYDDYSSSGCGNDTYQGDDSSCEGDEYDQDNSGSSCQGDEYDQDNSGCSCQGEEYDGDEYSDDYQGSSSSCEGDEYDSSEDSSCQGDDGDEDRAAGSSCDGDDYAEPSRSGLAYRAAGMCPTITQKRSRSVLSRQLNLLLPVLTVWLLCYWRRRSLERAPSACSRCIQNVTHGRLWPGQIE